MTQKKTPSPHTQWAKEVLLAHFEHRKAQLPTEEILKKQGACFVSLHNADGSLRGCIGTILPTKENLIQEIEANALSAAFHDPRFHPLQQDELAQLDISVDVLGKPEVIERIEQLDPKIYGVIVGAASRRGVLLPDLEGVNTVEQQLHIAMQKAGISPQTPIQVQRFRVDRFH